MNYPPVLAPCKDCKERFELCHSVCPKYLEYDAYRKMVRQERKKAAQGQPTLSVFKKRKKWRH